MLTKSNAFSWLLTIWCLYLLYSSYQHHGFTGLAALLQVGLALAVLFNGFVCVWPWQKKGVPKFLQPKGWRDK